MKVIAVVSAKGGVGKTTLAANLASVLGSNGRRVIAVDFDPQNALRLHFGIPVDHFDGVSRATVSGDPWRSVMFDGIDGVTVLPHGALNEDDRRAFEARLDSDPHLVRAALESLGLEPTDIVLIDTPPGATVYTRAALLAARFVLNVVIADAASYAAIPHMERLIQTYAVPRADFIGYGYVINQVDIGRNLTKDVLKVLRASLEPHLFPGVVHLDQGVSESLAYDTTVIHYDPLSQAAADLRTCGDWLDERLNGQASLQGSVA
ncbi:cellulose biosynthesis protein BcsQ [Paraburkholderia sp. SOS3]|jgi:cellulose synthase operon protein YhjQ|uniref:cellulose biosynthesis protein BcsQ n=1 Tax=Paraburkholderia sp. SOS3 TaxID=1926494 RepID=UPI00094777CF|nr:cellulose biosynthesis protein BcsQ [Paraburkholderia sp. SOS3]APR39496.1 cellulose synthase operon protein YhjQ [Paraburkholderia sp. SOS3]